LVCWLAFTGTIKTAFCLGRLGYKQPPLCEFLDSHISEINRGRNRNLVCWCMCWPGDS